MKCVNQIGQLGAGAGGFLSRWPMREAMVHLDTAKSSSIGRCDGGTFNERLGVAARFLHRCTG
jgi:hypothetical protein